LRGEGRRRERKKSIQHKRKKGGKNDDIEKVDTDSLNEKVEMLLPPPR